MSLESIVVDDRKLTFQPYLVGTVIVLYKYVVLMPIAVPLTEVLGDPIYFDAFVSYADEDLNFVKQMIVHLEENQGFKLCLPGRDLLPGLAKYSAIGELIEHR